MDTHSISVYNLITKLCENYNNIHSHTHKINSTRFNIKAARARCYEVLLSKRFPGKELEDELENNSDPVCHLLAWQYQLMTKYSLPKHADKLRQCCEKLLELNVFKDPTYVNLVVMLLQLRSVPGGEDKIMETTLSGNYSEQAVIQSSTFSFFDESKFQLPHDKICGNAQFEDEHFKLHNKKVGFKTTGLESATDFIKVWSDNATKNDHPTGTRFKDEGYKSQKVNIWEIAAQQPPNEHRTWETFGCYTRIKELPFLCESGLQSMKWLENLSLQLGSIVFDNCIPKQSPRRVASKQFVQDIKYLLVGMQSKTFTYDVKGDLVLVPGVYLEGLCSSTVESYCKDLIFCSNCYKGLNSLCTPEQRKSKDKPNRRNGYIFAELCESIRRYLSYYRIAVFSISDTTNLLMLHERTRQLRTYVTVLASVCKVGPFMESGNIPQGVALLNYLYQKVMSLTNTNVLMVLYSILYPCCQVYFSRFLQQWILEGTVQDPYGEFFINVHPKYVMTRGRTYWTRSYTLREDIVPDFITDLRADILLCGKAINLLKTCIPNSPLCLYLMDKQPDIISCCLMAEQLSAVEQNNYHYYLEATAICGPRMSLSQTVMSSKEQNNSFLDLIAKKRVATLNRIELERKKEAEKQNEKKLAEITFLQEQYEDALKQKQIKQAEEFEEEINIIERDIKLQTLHDRIIQEEAANLMEYYGKLFEAAENRRLFFEKHTQELKKVQLDTTTNLETVTELDRDKFSSTSSNSTEGAYVTPDKNSSTLSSDFQSAVDFLESKSEYVLASAGNSNTDLQLNANLDVINANSVITEEVIEERQEIIYNKFEESINIAIENYKTAQKNKAKVLAQEMGIIIKSPAENVRKDDNSNVTDAQRNKLKVMSSEFGLDIRHASRSKKSSSLVEVNRNKMMASNECFTMHDAKQTTESICDNANYLNINIITNVNNNVDTNTVNDADINLNVTEKWVSRKQENLSLDFTNLDNNAANNKPLTTEVRSDQIFNLRPIKGPKFELDKVSPMSIDSTPLSGVTTPSRLTASFDTKDFENQASSEMITATTANTHYEEGFKFEIDDTESYFNFQNRKSVYNIQNQIENAVLSKNITYKDAKSVSNSCLKLCLQRSISIPLITQIKLVTNELLKYFVNDLQYLKHLNSLRNYFFLLDGEFGRNITEGLFKKLYDANFPVELVNCHTLQVLVYKALDYSTKFQENSECLSFRINTLPKIFDLGDPDVFDCISLTYKTGWPLNILLPSDTITKYDEVFKFLLKLHRVSWVLGNIFQDLKSLVKETDSDKMVLLMSPQYRRLHQCRHIMTHFIQTLQSYVVGEVLQSSWEIFEKNMESVVNIDQMYALHTSYIKNILFMCLLNQKSAPLRKVLHNIFIVILKFYDYLRSRSWNLENNVYTHPNFKKLEDIFANFEDLVLYLFKVGHKVVKSGYQPHLMQLLDMLDINNYYSKRNISDVSLNNSSR